VIRRSRGFTLIEIAVAVAIAVVIAFMGWSVINQGIKNRTELREQQAHLLELQTAVRLIEQDFVQLVPRPVRQAQGAEPAQPALQGGTPGANPIAALTRGGWANPAGLQRTGLQRVAYLLEDGTLKREYWNVLDPTLASPTVKRDLLKHVKTVTIRYLDQSRQWQDQWPPATATTIAGPTVELTLRMRPLAVEITLDTEDWGKIVRIVEIAG